MLFDNCIKIKEYLDSIQISSYRIYDSSPYSISSKNGIYITDSDEINRISSSRSFSLARDYLKSNTFDYFFTLTLKDDIRFDIPKAIKLITDSINTYYKYSLRNFNKVKRTSEGSESLERVKIMRDFHTRSYDSDLRSEERASKRRPLRPIWGAPPTRH